MFCPKCGTDLGDHAVFCSRCGLDTRTLRTAQSDPLSVFVPAQNKAALTGYYLGVFSFACGPFLGIPAIMCGIAGLRKYNAQPGVRGRTHAITAIVLGSITTILTFLLFVWVAQMP